MDTTEPRKIRSDGAATRQRLLAAATEEFAARGNAGARIDRIAAAAAVNKSQIYVYFHSKNALFDTVLRTARADLSDLAVFDARDLPGYAVRLYDAYIARPDTVRLAAWNRLEHRPEGDLFADAEPLSPDKRQAIIDAQGEGHVTADLDPADIHAMVVALAMTWSAVSFTFVATDTGPPDEHERRRAALAAAVRGATTPAVPTQTSVLTR